MKHLFHHASYEPTAGSPSLSGSRQNTLRDDSAMQQCVSDIGRESEAKNAHFHDLAMLLLTRMQVDSVESTSLGLSPPERRKMVYEAGSISKSLGVGVRIFPISQENMY